MSHAVSRRNGYPHGERPQETLVRLALGPKVLSASCFEETALDEADAHSTDRAGIQGSLHLDSSEA